MVYILSWFPQIQETNKKQIAIESIASILTINNGIVPPTINYDTPDPECDLNYVPNAAIKKEINTVMCDNSGFGGHADYRNIRILFGQQSSQIVDLILGEFVDAIEDLYGPNLLCWTTNFFIKEARNPAFVSWHQDSTYWGLDRPDVVTAWIALTPSNKSNGAMGFIAGTHTAEQIPHRDTFAKNNLLTRGQEVAVAVDEKQAVTIELAPGEMSQSVAGRS